MPGNAKKGTLELDAAADLLRERMNERHWCKLRETGMIVVMAFAVRV
jgi:hypothetical protein